MTHLLPIATLAILRQQIIYRLTTASCNSGLFGLTAVSRINEKPPPRFGQSNRLNDTIIDNCSAPVRHN